MGQVKSHIADYFSNSTDEQKANEDDHSKYSTNSTYIRKKIKISKDRDLNDSYTSSTPLLLDSLATPRNPLKRSRTTSPLQHTTLPQSFLDIFSPSKKIKIDDEFLDFNFLDDAKTVNYYKKSKMMIILRGLPGSGKSIIAKHLQRKYIATKVCSADHFFMKDGEYVYNRDLIKDAHAQCQQNAIEAVQEQFSIVIIDNTNVKLWEMKFYLDLAKEFNYISVIAEPKTPWKRELSTLVDKTVHHINEEIMTWKIKDFEELSPLYYGWFLNDADSIQLIRKGFQWLKYAYSLSQFKEDMQTRTFTNSLKEFINYYEKPSKGLLVHCTAKYIGNELSADNKTYMDSDHVQNGIGKAFDIKVVGFVVTPRTFGARIELSSEQLLLWGKDDNEKVHDFFYDEDTESFVDMPVNGNVLEIKKKSQHIYQKSIEHMNGKGEFSINKPELNGCEGTNGVESGHNDSVTSEHDSSSLSNNTNSNGADVGGEVMVEASKENEILDTNLSNHENEKGADDSVNGKESSASLNPDNLLTEEPADDHPDKEIMSTNHDDSKGEMEIVNNSPEKNNLSQELRKDSQNGFSPHLVPSINLSAADDKLEVSFNLQESVWNHSNPEDKDAPAVASPSKSFNSSPKKHCKMRKGGGNRVPQNTLNVEDSVAQSTWTTFSTDDKTISPTSGKGSRAHFTLGCAPNYTAVTTGIDLIMAVRKEKDLIEEMEEEESEDKQINGSLLSCSSHLDVSDKKLPLFSTSGNGGDIYNYGDGVWVIYLEEELVATSIFTSHL